MGISKPISFNISFFDADKAARNFNRNGNELIAYARLSVDEDGQNYCSILNQFEIIKGYIDKNYKKYNLSKIADDDKSGYSFERPGLFELLSKIESGKCNTIIAKDLSRIGRHNAQTNLFIEQCQSLGIRVIAIDEYDSEKESDDMLLGIRTWSNERVVKDASSKVRKIVDYKQRNGTWFCGAPYGYKVTDYKNRNIQIDPEAAEVVKRVFEMYANGIGMKKITVILSEEGVPTPTAHYRNQAIASGKKYGKTTSERWVISVICKMLGDDFYIGNLRTNKYSRRGINGKDIRVPSEDHYVFENHHESIISQELFDEVQEQRKRRSDENFRGHKQRENIFRGLLRCGECGAVLFAYRTKEIDPQYICSTYFRYNKSACTRHMIKEKVLVQITIDYLASIRDKCCDAIKNLDKELSKIRRSKDAKADTIAKLKLKISKMQDELLVIEEQRIKQIMARPGTEDSINAIYDKMYEKTSADIKDLNDKYDTMGRISRNASEMQKKARTSLEIIDNIIATKEITRKKVETIFDKIIVYENGAVEVCLKHDLVVGSGEPYQIIDKALKQPDKKYSVVNRAINDVREGDPLETTFTSSAMFVECMHDISLRMREK